MFTELRPILAEAFDLAPEGAVYVVDERMRASSQGKTGWRNCNLRTQFQRIIDRAGLTAWPRLFHNLRSSRQTELAEMFPSHVVCDWLGNSEEIARKHYYQTTDDHFAQATADEEGGAESGAQAAQIAAQQAHARSRTASHEWNPSICATTRCATSCEDVPVAAKTQKRMGRDSNPRYGFP